MRTVSNLRDPLDGPCVIPVYTQAGLDEVRSWATASPPVHPVTCVDFILPAPSQKVLVLVPRGPGPTVRLATLHSLSAQCPGPKPLSIAVSPELDDKALNADAKALSGLTFGPLSLASFAMPNALRLARLALRPFPPCFCLRLPLGSSSALLRLLCTTLSLLKWPGGLINIITGYRT